MYSIKLHAETFIEEQSEITTAAVIKPARSKTMELAQINSDDAQINLNVNFNLNFLDLLRNFTTTSTSNMMKLEVTLRFSDAKDFLVKFNNAIRDFEGNAETKAISKRSGYGLKIKFTRTYYQGDLPDDVLDKLKIIQALIKNYRIELPIKHSAFTKRQREYFNQKIDLQEESSPWKELAIGAFTMAGGICGVLFSTSVNAAPYLFILAGSVITTSACRKFNSVEMQSKKTETVTPNIRDLRLNALERYKTLTPDKDRKVQLSVVAPQEPDKSSLDKIVKPNP